MKKIVLSLSLSFLVVFFVGCKNKKDVDVKAQGAKTISGTWVGRAEADSEEGKIFSIKLAKKENSGAKAEAKDGSKPLLGVGDVTLDIEQQKDIITGKVMVNNVAVDVNGKVTENALTMESSDSTEIGKLKFTVKVKENVMEGKMEVSR